MYKSLFHHQPEAPRCQTFVCHRAASGWGNAGELEQLQPMAQVSKGGCHASMDGKNTRKPSQEAMVFVCFCCFYQSAWAKTAGIAGDCEAMTTYFSVPESYHWSKCSKMLILDALPCHQFDCWMGSTWCSMFNHFAKKNFENFHIVNIVQNCASSFLLLLKHPTAFAPQ